MAWVVKTWEASPRPNEKGEYVRITGRQEGIISFVMSYFGIDPTVNITVTEKNYRLETRTFWGYAKRTIPIARISEVQDGFARAWLAPIIFWVIGLLVVSGAFPTLFGNGGVVGAFGMLFIAAIFFGIGYLIYHLSRFLVIGVVGFGGSSKDAWGANRAAAIAFKPSFIEGQKIDADAAERVGIIIQALVDRKS